ncbi:MAG: hypothetical protein SPI74_00430 [Eubacterium sp.]|nr:hypothetical protein [Eubacterium sp.]
MLYGRGSLLKKRLRNLYKEYGNLSLAENYAKAVKAKIISVINADRIEQELLNSCLMGRNLAIIYAGKPMSTDYILEELMRSSNLLKSVYGEMISSYRKGRDKEAFEILYKRVPIKAAKNFSMILSKIDMINPAELSEYMSSFEESLEDERMTKGIKKSEKQSLIVNITATLSIFALLMNFTVTVIFSKAQILLEGVF